MPNWCEGTLKVRGKQKDIKRFVLEGLKPVGVFGNEKESLTVDECECVSSKYDCWIEGTQRGFVEDLDVYFDDEDEDEDKKTHCFETRFAWGIDAKPLAEISKKYSVDLKIYAFERGMEFNQDIEIIDGEIVKDEEIKFDDYQWECVCPTIGG